MEPDAPDTVNGVPHGALDNRNISETSFMIASVAQSQRLPVLFQFIRFGMVGGLGFLVDTLVVYGLRSSLGLYVAGLASYIVAASFTWMLNRLWTFRGLSTGSALRQWGLFMLANLSGFVLNRGTYAILVTVWALAAENPIVATAAGAIAGMFVNFRMSRRLVFR